MERVKIGIELAPQFGDMPLLRRRWMEADELGVDSLWTCDHFMAMQLDESALKREKHSDTASGKNFEGSTIHAAMAATTKHADVGCMVYGNSYRNPNLLADMARTIDHLSGGRCILGIGSGYLQPEYEEYGYEYGTAKSRMLDLARNVPLIKARFGKLNPAPLRKIPLLVAALGEQIGLRIVAEHADMWNVAGDLELMHGKTQALRRICGEVGREFSDIELTAMFMPPLHGEKDLDAFLELGMRHIIVLAQGPDWDLAMLRKVLAWRDGLQV